MLLIFENDSHFFGSFTPNSNPTKPIQATNKNARTNPSPNSNDTTPITQREPSLILKTTNPINKGKTNAELNAHRSLHQHRKIHPPRNQQQTQTGNSPRTGSPAPAAPSSKNTTTPSSGKTSTSPTSNTPPKTTKPSPSNATYTNCTPTHIMMTSQDML